MYKKNSITKGDSLKLLKKIPDKSIDLIFADPPYNLQLRETLYRPDQTTVEAVTNDWDKFEQIIKLGGFVNCNPDFKDQPKIINGASDLLVNIFEDKGRHARFAVGSNALPLNMSVEIEATIQLK